MTIEYASALASMRLRRTGPDYTLAERYQKRASEPSTQYALGGMQEVDGNFTSICLTEGLRVGKLVKDSITTKSDLKFQGSVPLNTHIRRGSDVDVLVITDRFFTYSTEGRKASTYAGTYTEAQATDDMKRLRKECETALINGYPAADVDITGSKSISVSGGSLLRKVDIVPANWFEGEQYQSSEQEYDKGIMVYDKHTQERPKNWPFLFMRKIDITNGKTQDGTKKAIRLIKNIINDSSRGLELSSYDVASIVWNMPIEWLNVSTQHELKILASVQAYLEYLRNRLPYAETLDTPDLSRKIFNKKEKLENLGKLSLEVDHLAEAVYAELKQKVRRDTLLNGNTSPDQIQQLLNEAVVAA